MKNEIQLPIRVKISKSGDYYVIYLPRKLNELWKQLYKKEVIFYLKLSHSNENR